MAGQNFDSGGRGAFLTDHGTGYYRAFRKFASGGMPDNLTDTGWKQTSNVKTPSSVNASIPLKLPTELFPLWTSFPDLVRGPMVPQGLAAHQQQAASEVSPDGFAFLTPIAICTVFVSRVGFVWTHAAEQPFFAESRAPEGKLPTDWQPQYPDRALGHPVPVHEQPFFALYPRPEDQIQHNWSVFPDRIDRPFSTLHPSQRGKVQVFTPLLNPYDWYPEAIEPKWKASGLLPHEQQAFAAMFLIVPAAPTQFPTYFPDRLPAPTTLHGSQRSISQVFTPMYQPWPVFPDHVVRPVFSAAEQLAFATSPRPEGTIQLDWEPEFPDSVIRATELSDQQPFFGFYPLPLAATTAPLIITVFPDLLFRATLQVDEQPSFAFAPSPENTLQLDWEPEFPDTVIRAWLPTADQLFFATSMAPERTSPLACVAFPDRIERSYLPTAAQLAATEVFPKPEEEIQLDWDPCYPDRAARAWLATADQSYFAFSPFPERSSQLASVVFPDRVDRPFLLAQSQLAVTELSPKPEEPIQLDWDPCYPDRASRAWLPIAAYPAFVTSQFPEDRVELDWDPQYPDRATRTWLPTSAQFYFAMNIAPERTQALACTVFPDRVDRPAVLAANQLAVTELSPYPERTAPIAAAVFPDRVDRPFYPVTEQWVTSGTKSEEPTDLVWEPVYPDRALRVLMPTAEQPYFTLAPFPERVVPIVSEVHPDQVLRPFFATSSQLAVSEVLPKPEEEIQLDWDPSYPDRATRAWMLTAEHLAFATSQKPELTTALAWEPVYPDKVVRSLMLSSEQPYFAFAPAPERTSAIAAPVFPDMVPRPFFVTADQLAVTELSPYPERTSALAAVYFPDRVDRPFYPTTEQWVTSGTKPEDTKPLDWSPAYPDRALHAWLLVADQLAFTLYPRPVDEVALDWDPCYPDHATRAWFSVADQPFFTSNVAPERTQLIAVAVFPDRIDRPFLSAERQLAVTSISPYPEETLQLDWDPQYPDRAARAWLSTANQMAFAFSPRPEGEIALDWDPVYPDRVLRPWVPGSEQPFLALAPYPERTQAIAFPVFPDRVDRPFLLPLNQLAVTEVSPYPERTSPLAAVVFPDRVERAFLQIANYPAISEVYPQPEEEIALDWEPTYPDRALRAWLPVADYPFFAANIVPERTYPIAVAIFPDRVERPFLVVADQLAVTELSPQPERTSPLASVSYPDRIDRPFLLVANQLASTELSPAPERTSPLASVIFSDRVDRPFLLAHEQLAYADFAPRPEERVQLDWSPSYPDRALHVWLPTADQMAFVGSPSPITFTIGEQQFTYFPDIVLRPYVLAANQLAVTEFYPEPERTQSLAVAVFPDHVDRPFLTAERQMAVTEVYPRPEDKVDLDWSPSYPDRALHLWLLPADQLAVTELPPYPERTSTLAVVVFPDRVDRPFFLASEQLASTELSPQPEERVQLDWSPSYPDRALHAWLLVGDQQAYAANIFPIATTPTQPYNYFPEHIERARTLDAASQLAVTERYPQPENTIQLDWNPVYPDRAKHAWLGVEEYQFFASNVEPEERADLVWEPVYPDRALRAWLATADQPFFAFAPKPERTSPFASTSYPDRVERPYLPVAAHLAVTELPPRPEEAIQLDWSPSYPDRALHIWLLPAEQLAFVLEARPEEPTPFDWGPVYPDFARRPFLATAEHQFFAINLNVAPSHVIATGVWLTYAVMSGSIASIGHRTGASPSAVVLRAPVPVSPPVSMPIAAPTPPAPAQGPTPVAAAVNAAPPVVPVPNVPTTPEAPVAPTPPQGPAPTRRR